MLLANKCAGARARANTHRPSLIAANLRRVEAARQLARKAMGPQ